MRLLSLPTVALLLVVSACGAPTADTDTTTTAPVAQSSTSTTSAGHAPLTTTPPPATTTTTAGTTPVTAPAPSTTTTGEAPPAFFRYGAHGVTLVEGGRETVLVDVPVASAWSDGAGGLLFSHHWLSEVPGIWRVPTGTSEPIVAVPNYQGTYAVVALDDRAAIVRYDDYENRRCESGSIGLYDLESGAPHEGLLVCSGDGDVGWFPSSYGGELLAGVRWDDSGSCRTMSGILFWDLSGAEIDIPTNPYPLARGAPVPDWIPCELDAHLSPDGRLLAYRFRPDNKWPCPEYDEVLYEDWLEESRSIPGVVIVMDVDTGTETFRVQSEAEERLTGFDGRFIVLTSSDRRWDVPLDQLEHTQTSTIIDITGSNPDHIVDGRVRLVWINN